jgi:hypothetical protein
VSITNFQARTLPSSRSIEVHFGEEQILDPQWEGVIAEALERDARNPMTREPLIPNQLYPNKLAEDVVKVVNELAEILGLD